MNKFYSIALSLFVVSLVHSQAANYTVTDLGVGEPYAINSNGWVTGLLQTGAFRFEPNSANSTNGTVYSMTSLTVAYGINDQGSIVGQTNCDIVIDEIDNYWGHPALWETNGTTTDLGTFANNDGANPTGRAFDRYALGINGSGEIVGWISDENWSLDNGAARGFFTFDNGSTKNVISTWETTADSWYPLSSGVSGVNDSGQIVGFADGVDWSTYNPDDGTFEFYERAFLAQSNSTTKVNLGILSGATESGNSRALGINSTGRVVGYSHDTNGNTHAFIWVPTTDNGTNGTMTDLGTLANNNNSFARAINSSNVVVGACYSLPNYTGTVAFVYDTSSTNNVMQSLNILGSAWIVRDAFGINAYGQIIVTATATSNGQTHALLLTP